MISLSFVKQPHNISDPHCGNVGFPGLSKPLLHLNKGVVTEGEEITATCTAHNETGSIFFYFYEGSELIAETKGSSSKLETKLSFSSVGIHKIHCSYTVSVMPDSFKSTQSNTVNVSVKGEHTEYILCIYVFVFNQFKDNGIETYCILYYIPLQT